MKKSTLGLLLSTALLTSAIFPTNASAGEMSKSLNIFKTANDAVPLGSSLADNTSTTAQMSKAEKKRAIEQMGKNQGNVWVWSKENVVKDQERGPNGGPGQFNGGSVVLGGRASYDPPADWYYLGYKRDGMTDEQAKELFDSQRGKYLDRMDPWGVVMEMQDNKAKNAWFDVRNMQAFVLRENETTWENLINDPVAVDWIDYFEGNMYGWIKPAKREKVYGFGTSVKMQPKEDKVAHWGSKQILSVPSPESIRAVLISVEARISEKSDPNAKLGIQVGADWKFSDESPAEHPLWYPGAGLSGVQRLTKDWARYYFVSVEGIQDAMPERAISVEKFYSTVVPLADISTDDNNTTVAVSKDELKSALDNKEKNVVLATSVAKFALDKKAFEPLSKKGDVTVSLTPANKLNKLIQKAVGNRPVYDIILKADNKKVTTLKGNLKISLVYKKDSKENAKGLYVAYVNNNGKIVRIKGSSYNNKTGRITFTTKSLKRFAVMYEAPKKTK